MSKSQTTEEFIKKSTTIFGSQLDYSKVKYINSRTIVILTCKKHGDFCIKPKDHISYKRGCSICSGVEYNTDTFIGLAKKIHGNKFSYIKTKYTGIKSPIVIICKLHGDFLQKPDKHINARQGCPKCKKSARKDLNYVVKMGTLIHNGKYDYSKSVFTKMFENMIIICPQHGEFKQTPANHINHKQNCPACMIGTSKKEIAWLDSIQLSNDFSHRAVIIHVKGRRFIVDGYNPESKTVYEFYGDFWHGNPKIYDPCHINDANHISFGELYQKTVAREKLLNDYGYNVVSIWENEFDKICK